MANISETERLLHALSLITSQGSRSTVTIANVSEPPPQPRQLPQSVSYPDGDIILHANDGYAFRVHRSVLAKRSLVLRDMLSVPELDENSAEETPTISLDEDSDHLNNMLRLIYHISEMPDLSTTKHLTSLLDACDKYQLPTDTVAGVSFTTHENPLRTWAIATRYGLEDIKQKSAIRAIQMDEDAFLKDAPAEFACIDGMQCFGLITQRNRAIILGRRILSGMSWDCRNCGGISLKKVYLERTKTLNPFCPEATAKLMFELCVALNLKGCPDNCLVALKCFNEEEREGSNRSTLLRKLDVILQRASRGQLVEQDMELPGSRRRSRVMLEYY